MTQFPISITLNNFVFEPSKINLVLDTLDRTLSIMQILVASMY